MTRFLLKYASRSRPRLFQQRICNWTDYFSGANEMQWSCTFDADDETMNTKEIKDFCQQREITHHYGNSKSKVEAINADVPRNSWDVLVLVSDDMMVMQRNWDEIVSRDFAGYFDQALWYPDGIQPRVNTLSIMGKGIYNRLGYIYCPEFTSLYCDDHYQWTLQRSGLLKQIKHDNLFRHQWGEENTDDLMTRNEDPLLRNKDHATFQRLTGRTSAAYGNR